MTPKWCSCLFFLAIQCPRQHVTAKSGIPDQTDGIYTLFPTKMANSIPYFRLEMIENDTLWGGTYLYGFAYGILPPPPLPGGDPLGPFPLNGWTSWSWKENLPWPENVCTCCYVLWLLLFYSGRYSLSMAYRLTMDSDPVHVYCHMQPISGCGPSAGWTLVMKIDGSEVWIFVVLLVCVF